MFTTLPTHTHTHTYTHTYTPTHPHTHPHTHTHTHTLTEYPTMDGLQGEELAGHVTTDRGLEHQLWGLTQGEHILLT